MKPQSSLPFGRSLSALAVGLAALWSAAVFGQDATTVVLAPVKDNTIFEEGEESSGAGDSLYSGATGLNAGFFFRRALLAFDVAGSVPPGATIQTAKLTLKVTKAAPGSTVTDMALHRLTRDWGEGASVSPLGAGVAAQEGDATWTQNFFGSVPAELWAVEGGDFVASASATASVGMRFSTAEWASSELSVDVQGMLDNPGADFGWILIGDELGVQNARKFGSKENPDPQLHPVLTIEYIPPPSSGIEITAVRIDAGNVLATFTAGGNVDVYRSTGLQDFGASPIATDLAPGTDVIFEAVALPGAFYVLVPTGGPAP